MVILSVKHEFEFWCAIQSIFNMIRINRERTYWSKYIEIPGRMCFLYRERLQQEPNWCKVCSIF